MKNTKAFSLIELLISLIIISLITAVFAPVMTKKFHKGNLALSNKNVTTNCLKFDSENRCLMCTLEACTLCSTQINTPKGSYVEVEKGCDIKECDKKFSNCIECTKDFCTKCEDGYFLKDNLCMSCPSGCMECISQTECKKCKDGYLISKKMCKKMTDVPCLAIGNICVAKFNAGDSGGLSIPNGITFKNTVADASSSSVHSQAICYTGLNTDYCDANNGGYSGCSRTICTYYAADKICTYHGWRLPNDDEVKYFAQNSIGKGANGLQLCDAWQGYSSARCMPSKRCPNAPNGLCYSYHIWLDRVRTVCLTKGTLTFPPKTIENSHAMSVRCVRDL